ncbi:MAG: phosphatidylglycerophosphatase A [Methylophilaceae bacterium]|nr:phosphatidylglycerophosphatase A [Methylophilaceae bacterium]MBL6726879.1 phosphatidylglycerophosphatase A [Methylophilaceae bacterium]MBL6728155.1 phosphatidylglycerophosphatase A [Methylophilaceae bacterium]MBL6791102.1 phosphatidylglycerophosphatase A [Methylophilaceae bacterium]
MINRKFLFANINHFIALGFGAGLFKKGPGTAGSLVAIPLFFLIINFNGYMQWLFLITLFFIGIHSSNITCKNLKLKDPSCIVIDEIVALIMLLLLIPISLKNLVLGFIIFRLFDIFKPFPISWAEKKFHDGFGVMLDDILAALFSFLIFQVIYYVF